MAGKIIKCDCEHEFQDKNYGKGKRYATATNVKTGSPKFTCTVCDKKD